MFFICNLILFIQHFVNADKRRNEYRNAQRDHYAARGLFKVAELHVAQRAYTDGRKNDNHAHRTGNYHSDLEVERGLVFTGRIDDCVNCKANGYKHQYGKGDNKRLPIADGNGAEREHAEINNRNNVRQPRRFAKYFRLRNQHFGLVRGGCVVVDTQTYSLFCKAVRNVFEGGVTVLVVGGCGGLLRGSVRVVKLIAENIVQNVLIVFSAVGRLLFRDNSCALVKVLNKFFGAVLVDLETRTRIFGLFLLLRLLLFLLNGRCSPLPGGVFLPPAW